jgi:methylphosphotriester-DNA--protein-cysteine methyltransferase
VKEETHDPGIRSIEQLKNKARNSPSTEKTGNNRILQASIKLETTTKTITEISYAYGYNSISCFFHDFGQIFSLTPRQFRNSRGDNGEHAKVG